MEINVLEKAASLATESLKKIQAPAVEKAQAESKAAADAKVITDAEEEKGKGIKLAEAEAKAKDDVRILSADDKDLSEPESKRKAELQEKKRVKDDSPDEKIKRVQEASQKRIDEIVSKLKDTENKTAEQIKRLETELSELKKPKVESDSKRVEAERVAKYVEEDKSKSREDRREMSKESLEEWYLEDPLAATEWIQDRSVRRSEERKALEAKGAAKNQADDFIKKQNESKLKLFDKYPGVNPSAERLAELKGKTPTEIREALCAENEEFRICTEIVAENPKKYLEADNGPELVMAEMEKRLKSGTAKKVVTMTEDELEAKIQAETERRSRLDEGITSTKGKKPMDKEQTKSEFRKRQEAIAKKAGIKVEDLDKTIERRRGIPGATQFEDGE